MMRLPFIGRLHIAEYLSLFFSLTLIGIESFLGLFTLFIPSPLIRLSFAITHRLFDQPRPARVHPKDSTIKPLPRGYSEAEAAEYDGEPAFWDGPYFSSSEQVKAIAAAPDFLALCSIFGYEAEEHLVKTRDGYVLGVHRLCWTRAETRKRRLQRTAGESRRGVYNIDDVDDGTDGSEVNGGPGRRRKPVVYLHHGLVMSSDVWVCLSGRGRSLAFELVERGYDVWLGNNRGNRYSRKSFAHRPSDARFWQFSLDEFAFFDIPDTISYILSMTAEPSLGYIGFSQGSAQAFAALSVNPSLNDKINVFIALAPALAPPGLTSSVVNALVQTSPQVLYLAFGRRSVLGSTRMWQSLLYPPLFVKVIDFAVRLLFGWRSVNISQSQKLAAYPHMYDYSSTQTVVHWFQIIRSGTFQMFDDEVGTQFGRTRPVKYPTRNIRTPIALLYGTADSLVDPVVMKRELPASTIAIPVPGYEHLDFLWAKDTPLTVFPHVFRILEKHQSFSCSGSGLGSDLAGLKRPNGTGLAYPAPLNRSEQERAEATMPAPPAAVAVLSGPRQLAVGRSRGVSLSSGSVASSSSAASPYRHSLLGSGLAATPSAVVDDVRAGSVRM